MNTVYGNLLETDVYMIAHQVNCLGIMGGGVARQIKEKWHYVYTEYRDYIERYENNNKKSPLGTSCYSVVGNHMILNIFGQEDVSCNSCMTDYNAVRTAFEDFISGYRRSQRIPDDAQIQIAIPYKFGCGLAGGDWNIMTELLEDIEKQYNVLFIAHRLE
jgi:hypothetical protein